MTLAVLVSAFALLVSLGSLYISYRNFKNDQGTLDAKCRLLWIGEEQDKIGGLKVTIINNGKRPMIIHSIGGYSLNKKFGAHLVHSNFPPEAGEHRGYRLGELDRYETKYYDTQDFIFIPPGNDDPFEITELWVEDILGRRFKVKDSKKNIAKFVTP